MNVHPAPDKTLSDRQGVEHLHMLPAGALRRVIAAIVEKATARPRA